TPAVAAVTLAGQVSSAEEGPMEGVLVSAKKDGSTITTTVVTDDKGHYSFPADRIEPGHYTIAIRAIGYDLDGAKVVDLADGASTSTDLKLVKTKNLAAQLSNAEWLASMPGSDKDKIAVNACVSCHTLQRIVSSTHSPDEFKQIFHRMGTYSPGSVPTKPQPLLPGKRGERPPINDAVAQKVADLLSNANLSMADAHEYSLKTLPRPKGRATHVVITEYDLPNADWEPHDVVMDHEGMLWFSDFGDQRMGELDPKTGKVNTYMIPIMKPGEPKGGLEIDVDPSDTVWEAMMYQGGIVKFDRATKQIVTYKLPDAIQSNSTQESMVSPDHDDVDGYVWTNNQEDHSLIRLNLKTGKLENMGVEKDANGKPIPGYGIPTDLQNQPYMLEFGNTRVGHYNKQTGIAEVFNTPSPSSKPRRGRVDSQNRLWFAETNGNAIGMFDPDKKSIQEWKLSIPWSDPYDVVAAKNGDVWTGSMYSDFVSRLDPKSGEFTNYLLPKETNIRRVFVDNTPARPVLWVGNNHGGEIIKVEPTD
ncbi:MAG TPA: carboxypeptidase regulatory-like domain-containing protein, partial [Beijerinckiaceae bacterium]|nr:carboxypeptidase regulatory-like domain-containing protein [Beijerinckiaceae bacterium]